MQLPWRIHSSPSICMYLWQRLGGWFYRWEMDVSPGIDECPHSVFFVRFDLMKTWRLETLRIIFFVNFLKHSPLTRWAPGHNLGFSINFSNLIYKCPIIYYREMCEMWGWLLQQWSWWKDNVSKTERVGFLSICYSILFHFGRQNSHLIRLFPITFPSVVGRMALRSQAVLPLMSLVTLPQKGGRGRPLWSLPHPQVPHWRSLPRPSPWQQLLRWINSSFTESTLLLFLLGSPPSQKLPQHQLHTIIMVTWTASLLPVHLQFPLMWREI